MGQDQKGTQRITKNRKAYHNYFVDDEYEAGLVLVGTEVKSLREGKVHLKDSYARFRHGNELFLVNAHISPYSHATGQNHDPERPRKLLLHRHELNKLRNKVDIAGYTLIPLSLYFKGSNVKCQLGLCRGKKQFDKRRDLKERQHAREIAREKSARNWEK